MKIVIMDNENVWLKRIINDINKLLTEENFKIDIYYFKNYNEEFRKILYDGSVKIYIIDMELNDSINGYDIVHEIRDLIFD